MVDLSKWRVPAGSLMVDASLVVALVWNAATMTESLKHLSERMDKVEKIAEISVPDAQGRLRVLEDQNGVQDRALRELKEDIVKRLDSLDNKLDLLRREVR